MSRPICGQAAGFEHESSIDQNMLDSDRVLMRRGEAGCITYGLWVEHDDIGPVSHGNSAAIAVAQPLSR